MDIGSRTTVTICTAPSRMDLHPAVGSNDPWMLRSVAPRPHCHEGLLPGGKPSGAGQVDSRAAGSHAHARSRDKCWDIRTNRIPAGTGNWQLEVLSQAHDTTQVEEVCVEKNKTRSQRRTAADELEKVSKKVLAYRMGYDKTKETNLTKEKIKWALIYIV